MGDMLKVEQRHREAAAERSARNGFRLIAEEIRQGKRDNAASVQDFAKFERDHLTRPEAPQEGWREVLRMLIAADEEAKPNGVMDCVDNDGCPYQSAYMAGVITHARMLADPHPALSKGEGVTDELKGEGGHGPGA